MKTTSTLGWISEDTERTITEGGWYYYTSPVQHGEFTVPVELTILVTPISETMAEVKHTITFPNGKVYAQPHTLPRQIFLQGCEYCGTPTDAFGTCQTCGNA